MRPRLILAAALVLLLASGGAHAQTVEIQREVGVRLWLQWVLARVSAAAGAPPFVSALVLAALVLVVAASVWLWQSRRKPGG